MFEGIITGQQILTNQYITIYNLYVSVQAGPVDLPTATFGFGSSAIINGQDANIEDFPWQLSLLFLNGHTCGAILASETMALTAAHCVNGRFVHWILHSNHLVLFRTQKSQRWLDVELMVDHHLRH